MLNVFHLPAVYALAVGHRTLVMSESDKTGIASLSLGFHAWAVGGVVLFLALSPARAQRRKTFAESPSKRSERVQRAQVQAERDRSEVRAWARLRGLQVRHDDGRHVVEVVAIRDGRPIYYSTRNDDAAMSIAADEVRDTSPFNVDGAGVTVGVWDAGSVMTSHQEFGGRVSNLDSAATHYHATHVGGTIGAAGVVIRSEGMAPNVGIDSHDWNSDVAEMTASASSFPGESGKIKLSNHSYGFISGWFYASFINPWSHRSGYHWWGDITVDSAEAFFGQYNSYARNWDEIVYDAPYFLPFKSAGNERTDNPPNGSRVYYTPDGGLTWANTLYDSAVHPLGDGVYKGGYDSVSAVGNAKNIMTVGAVTDAVAGGLRNLSVAQSTVFSSWGPADDGRIKPDIVANGYELYSCNVSSASSYASRSGTSMSSPNACGSAALLVDWYDDLFPGQAMRASTLKGLIIHTADDLGRPGPDYQYGWGLMNTRRAAQLLKDHAEGHLICLTEAALSVSKPVDTYTCFVDAGEPVRITLCWTDPPGTATTSNDSRSVALVNDLDLKLTGPDGTFYPYTLTYSDPEANAASDSENKVDNVEQIYIAAPAAGMYTISVDFDGSLQNDHQWYSLLTRGVVSDMDGDGLPDNWEANYFLSVTGALASADADGDGFDNLSEYIAGSNPMDPGSIFEVSSVYPVPSTGQPPVVIEWAGMPGREYNVYWTYNLVYVPFLKISDAVYSPAHSFTDSVERAGNAAFYRIDVRLDQ
jgi:hypothetical protein